MKSASIANVTHSALVHSLFAGVACQQGLHIEGLKITYPSCQALL